MRVHTCDSIKINQGSIPAMIEFRFFVFLPVILACVFKLLFAKERRLFCLNFQCLLFHLDKTVHTQDLLPRGLDTHSNKNVSLLGPKDLHFCSNEYLRHVDNEISCMRGFVYMG